MQVHRSVEQLPAFTRSVLTIGTFDGVHSGHRRIIDALKAQAKAVGGESVIITFDPHPRKIVNPNESLQLITTLDEKIRLLEQAGIDHLVVVPFTSAFSSLTADEYLDQFLIKRFQPHTIIIGYDHRFGKGRQGDFQFLEENAEVFKYQLIEIPMHVLDEIAVSSTKIRNAILGSEVEKANTLLGYPFFFSGQVIYGDQLGRKLGYPTANLQYMDSDKIRLGHGVYAVYATVDGERKKGMMSIGIRPTLTHSDERVEVNIFDFDREIYGETISVEVKAFLRGQEKYASLDELVVQLHRDKANSLQLLD
jgi:riboflavin kinase/FMN adenylyltransferase